MLDWVRASDSNRPPRAKRLPRRRGRAETVICAGLANRGHCQVKARGMRRMHYNVVRVATVGACLEPKNPPWIAWSFGMRDRTRCRLSNPFQPGGN